MKSNLLEKVYKSIEKEKEMAFELNKYIFENPEISHKEFLAVNKYVTMLRNYGFEVEENYLGLATTFKAIINEDKESDIKIGILVEYDALPEIGHACGHSASGALSFLAALGLFENKTELDGNIYLFGTPAEEYNGAKIDFAKSGLFDDFSFVIMIHMYNKNQPYAKFMALDAFEFEFIGKPAHAAASPWEGKNAVNGMTLFIHALDMMRQQLRDGSRIHGMIQNGGSSGNTIPDYAKCTYMIRHKEKAYLSEIKKMIYDAANGAALATQTTVNIKAMARGGLADLKPNVTGEKLVEEIYESLGMEVYKGEIESLGSSDIGNMSYVCPAFHPMISVTDEEYSPHTREFAACMLMDKTKEAILNGSKTIAAMVVKSIEDKSIIEDMKRDFNK